VVLVILVLSGAKVREQLIVFDRVIPQAELTAMANKLSPAYSGLTRSQILAKGTGLTITEQQVADCLIAMMKTEDDREYEEDYLIDGLHFVLNQPEFAHNQRMLSLIELVEQRNLLRSIVPPEPVIGRVQVIIGKENKTEAIHDYSVIISRYGLPNKATGTIGVIGPTRMPYARTIATVGYLSSVLSGLAARLYGRETPVEPNPDAAS